MANDNRNKRAKRCKLKSICIILILLAGTDWQLANAGMAEGLTEGIKYAGQMFGINTAADVADLVARAFSNAATTTSQTKPDFFSTLFQQRQKPTAFPGSEEDDAQQETEQHATSQRKGEKQNEKNSNEKYDDDAPPAKKNAYLDLSSSKIITSVLRMIGFDARKLGALALNALVMMAQAIGNTLLSAFTRRTSVVSAVDGGRLFFDDNGDPTKEQDEKSTESDSEYRPRELRSGSPIDWYLENPTDDMKRLLSQAMDAKLADDLADMIGNAEKRIPNGENSAACIKMLMCKCSPFIWGMQKSLKKRLKDKNDQDDEPNDKDDQQNNDRLLDTSVFYKHLPSLKEFREHSAICNQRYGDHCRPNDVWKYADKNKP